MCHRHDLSARYEERFEAEPEDDEESSFLNEDRDAEVELLTDGGD
jgi:hypothetical protein